MWFGIKHWKKVLLNSPIFHTKSHLNLPLFGLHHHKKTEKTGTLPSCNHLFVYIEMGIGLCQGSQLHTVVLNKQDVNFDAFPFLIALEESKLLQCRVSCCFTWSKMLYSKVDNRQFIIMPGSTESAAVQAHETSSMAPTAILGDLHLNHRGEQMEVKCSFSLNPHMGCRCNCRQRGHLRWP